MAATTVGLLLAAGLGVGAMLGAADRGVELAARLGIPRPAVIAHRGAAAFAPEATRPAYLLAREMGADYLELDLQRTRDGALVAVHDGTLERTTDVAAVFPGRETEPVGSFTYTELQRLDAGSWFGARHPKSARPRFAGERVLRLEEVAAIAETGTRQPGLYIETKSPERYPGIERQLVEALASRGWLGAHAGSPAARVVFQSFSADSLARLKDLAPEVPRILLLDETMMARDGWDVLLARAQRVAHGLGTWGSRHAASPHWAVRDAPRRYLTLWPWYTGAAHGAGLVVHVWTVDAPWELRLARWSGADGVITNRPDLARSVSGLASAPDLPALWQRIEY